MAQETEERAERRSPRPRRPGALLTRRAPQARRAQGGGGGLQRVSRSRLDDQRAVPTEPRPLSRENPPLWRLARVAPQPSRASVVVGVLLVKRRHQLRPARLRLLPALLPPRRHHRHHHRRPPNPHYHRHSCRPDHRRPCRSLCRGGTWSRRRRPRPSPGVRRRLRRLILDALRLLRAWPRRRPIGEPAGAEKKGRRGAAAVVTNR